MKRREFFSTGFLFALSVMAHRGFAEAAKKLTKKDILREGQQSNLPNFCEKPEKQPNKNCPDWKAKPGHCEKCQFYNFDKSETAFEGKKFARCQLLADPSKPQFVASTDYCGSYFEKKS
jgi:hypothetical protein